MATIYCVWGEATEEHRKGGRILSMSSETEKGCKTGSKVKRYVKYSVIGVCDSSSGFNQDTRKPCGRGSLGDGEEMLGVEQAQVGKAGTRGASAGYNSRTPFTCDVSFTAFGSLVLHCHERHEEDSL